MAWIAQAGVGGLFPVTAQSRLVGHAGAEARFFFSDPLAPEQPRRVSLSAMLQPEYTRTLGGQTTVQTIALARIDQSDPNRSYLDLREALAQWERDPFTVRVGMNTVFWGVTESRHLVDIVNQTDYLADLDGDEKLGQLMALVTYYGGDLGFVDIFAMTWARPQAYPSPEGRPGVPFPVLEDSAVWPADHGQWSLDIAARWSRYWGEVDWALSYFHGTAREPELTSSGSEEQPTLLPRYDRIDQAGLELQWTRGNWLWKAESMVRSGQGPVFAAVTAGFEHTTVGVFGSQMDVGTILEYSYDGRENQTFNIYDNDVFGGLRLSLNDVQGSEVLAGVLQDLEAGVTLGSVEASRRLGTNWTVELVGRLFRADDAKDPLYWFRRDDYLQAVLEYHF